MVPGKVVAKLLKLIGAMCVILAGTAAGLFQANQLALRQRQIRQAIHALERLETEIAYGGTPLPRALASLAETTPAPLSGLFGKAADRLLQENGPSLFECWEQAIALSWNQTALKQPEREIFLRLGAVLGTSDRDDQRKHLRLAISQLLAEEKVAAEDCKTYGSMWRSLGLLSGILVVILMY